MRLLHYSRTPLESVYSVRQHQAPSAHQKPNGLWVSVEGEDDWPSWCQREEFGASFDFTTEVTLNLSRVLILKRVAALRKFTREFGVEAGGYVRVVKIDWAAVARRFGGIIIAPYVGECRLSEKTTWYYTWDCASGCIWDSGVVLSLQPVENRREDAV